MITNSTLRELFSACFTGEWGTDPADGHSNAVLRSTNFGIEGRLDLSDVVTRRIEPRVFARKRLCPGDILLEKSGGGPQQPVGRVVYFNEPLEATSSNFIQVCRPKSENDGRFVFYLLDHLYRSGVTLQFQQQTTGLMNLKLEEFLRVRIFRPSRAAQGAIANVLSVIDRAIEQTEMLLAKQHRIKAGLMHALLTRGLDAQGQLRDPATHRFKPTRYGPAPFEWDVSPASSLCDAVIDCKNRTPPSVPSGHPVIRTPNVRNGRFVYEDLVMTDSDSYEVWVSRGKPRVGDVVITREAPFGEACQIPKDIPAACLGQRMMMYQPNSEKVRADFLVYAIYSHAVQNRLLELAGGSTVGHIRVGDIRSLPIPHPVSLDEQREICEALNGVSSADVDSRSALTKLRRLKIGLMQDLLTGRVPVTSLLAEPQPALANT